MNGRTKLVLDTNAVIALLQGQENLEALLDGHAGIVISVSTVLEFESAAKLSITETSRFRAFCATIEVVAVRWTDHSLIDTIVHVRRDYRLKLPDAIVAATAIERDAILVTRDHHFRRINGLSTESF